MVGAAKRLDRLSKAMKGCANCKAVKPATEFYRDKGSKDGYASSCKECRRAFQASYRARSKPVARAYKVRNAERIAEYHRKHAIENRGMHWAIDARKRLRDQGFDPVIVEFTEAELFERYGKQCAYCGGEFQEIDHFIPLCAGGPHELDNVRPSCTTCNRRKLQRDLVVAKSLSVSN
jgi:5-methylcytosine-specific restriction endonuclease McrA